MSRRSPGPLIAYGCATVGAATIALLLCGGICAFELWGLP